MKLLSKLKGSALLYIEGYACTISVASVVPWIIFALSFYLPLIARNIVIWSMYIILVVLAAATDSKRKQPKNDQVNTRDTSALDATLES